MLTGVAQASLRLAPSSDVVEVSYVDMHRMPWAIQTQAATLA